MGGRQTQVRLVADFALERPRQLLRLPQQGDRRVDPSEGGAQAQLLSRDASGPYRPDVEYDRRTIRQRGGDPSVATEHWQHWMIHIRRSTTTPNTRRHKRCVRIELTTSSAAKGMTGSYPFISSVQVKLVRYCRILLTASSHTLHVHTSAHDISGAATIPRRRLVVVGIAIISHAITAAGVVVVGGGGLPR
jgi:hypothetical protein